MAEPENKPEQNDPSPPADPYAGLDPDTREAAKAFDEMSAKWTPAERAGALALMREGWTAAEARKAIKAPAAKPNAAAAADDDDDADDDVDEDADAGRKKTKSGGRKTGKLVETLTQLSDTVRKMQEREEQRERAAEAERREKKFYSDIDAIIAEMPEIRGNKRLQQLIRENVTLRYVRDKPADLGAAVKAVAKEFAETLTEESEKYARTKVADFAATRSVGGRGGIVPRPDSKFKPGEHGAVLRKAMIEKFGP